MRKKRKDCGSDPLKNVGGLLFGAELVVDGLLHAVCVAVEEEVCRYEAQAEQPPRQTVLAARVRQR